MTISAGTSNNNSGNIQNITCSITGASATNRCALIGILNDSTPPSSVTFGASACTLLASQGRIHIYSVIGQPSGAQTVTANQGAATNTIIGVAQFTADGALSFGTAVTNTNAEQTSLSVDVTSATGQLVVDVAQLVQASMTVGAGQTAIMNLPTGGSPPTGHDVGFLSFGMSYEAGAATTTMSWSASGTAGDNDIIAVNIIEAGGGGGSIGRGRLVGGKLVGGNLLVRRL